MNKANAEGWKQQRSNVESKALARAEQKTAEAAADNATLAQDIKHRLLERLKRIEAKYPVDATEVRQQKDGKTLVYKLRDLTAAYKDLTDDMPKVEGDKNAPIYELLEKLDGECNV
jgi:hypothetical protein